ncbi:MAG TPA: DUF2306 domain-containing protein [Sphingomicrobium sp.]|nr:DUF2306 domain-containing protein [Sphingomicrobium sp.]
MTRTAQAIRLAGFAALLLLALYISNTSVQRYLIGTEDGPPPIVANAFAHPWLAVHVFGAIVALVVGPFQFVSAIRARWPAIHKATGYSYLVACAVGVPAGLVLSIGATAGVAAGSGFAVLGLLTLFFTGQGVRAALARRFDEHREWMLRSYAMTAAAITLRLMIPASFMLQLDFTQSYRVIAWACWLTNLALVEYCIRRTRAAAMRFERLAAT